jgi:cyclomaltodextrinase / maltogenic alpha-amylase / neopullulanase
MPTWPMETTFYHIYPLGFAGAPYRNSKITKPGLGLKKISSWIDHMKQLGIGGLYLGPIFDSSSHGYDTKDYFKIDPRLGTMEDMLALSEGLKAAGIKLVLDGVFNHVGREFSHFIDLKTHGKNSLYTKWIKGLDFQTNNTYNDRFHYHDWGGCQELVKLNTPNKEVQDFFINVFTYWKDTLNFNGWRLDAADCLSKRFLRKLRKSVEERDAEFWLLGEVVFGNYKNIATPHKLHGVTNYEVYNGLHTSFNKMNFNKLESSLTRQSGKEGIYKNIQLYNFADNHDVNRVASSIREPRHLKLLYTILFTIPGIPSIYYGSEWGIKGKRSKTSDRKLRPSLELKKMKSSSPHPLLQEQISKLASLRQQLSPLNHGEYETIFLKKSLFIFKRSLSMTDVIVVINIHDKEIKVSFSGRNKVCPPLKDLLNSSKTIIKPDINGLYNLKVPPFSSMIFSA